MALEPPADSGNGGADRGLDLIDRVVRPAALYIGGAVAAGLAVMVVVAVGFRYVLNAPIHGAADIQQFLLIAVVAFSIAQSGRTGGQVAVEILGTVANPRVTRWTDALVKSIAAAMMIVLVVQLVENGISAAEYGETSLSLVVPYGPFYQLLAFGMALYAAVLIVEVVVHLRGRPVVHRTDSLEDVEDT